MKLFPLFSAPAVPAPTNKPASEVDPEDFLKREEDEAKRHDPLYYKGEFDSDFLRLVHNEPFLGLVSVRLSKVIDNTMPTAYVGVRPNGNDHEIILGINSRFFRSMSPKHRQGILKHELYHVILQHIFCRAIGDTSQHLLWNWATDLAINSMIGGDNLPKMVLCPGQAPIDPKTGKPVDGAYAEFIKNAPGMQSSDWYFKKLREIQDELGDSDLQIAIGSGMGSVDDHGKWGDLSPEVEEQIREKARHMIGDAVKEADRSNQWGNVPHEIQSEIRRIVSDEVDWRQIVSNFVGRIRTMIRVSTVRRYNKKAPYMFPGSRRKMRAAFACFIDQSGSVSDEDVTLFFGELANFSKHTDIDVYHFDTQIDEKSHTLWSKGKTPPPPHRTRCGGTDFNSVAEFCSRHENRGRWAGVVILTDGYAPTMNDIPGAKVLWVITETGTMEAVRSGDLACQMKKGRDFKRW